MLNSLEFSPLMNAFLLSVAVLQVWVHVVALLAIWRRNNTLADIFWGIGFILMSSTALWLRASRSGWAQVPLVSWLVWGLVLIWGLRLTWHIWERGAGKKEDWRYKKWREEWGSGWWWHSYLQVFLLQSVFLVMIAASPWRAVWNGGAPLTFEARLLVALGILVWGVGFLFESAADAQLERFKANLSNKGKILQSGLWRYSRHPNYFGEALLWWGIWILSMSVNSWAVGWHWLTLISPVTITILVRFVSGVPLLEKRYAGRPDFLRYQESTPIFVPWWPKLKRSSAKNEVQEA